MGVDYRGVVCVGYTYEQVEKLKEQAGFEGDFNEFVESEDFQSFAPYFDADKQYCIYGYYVVQSQDYCKQKVDLHKSASVAENLSAGLLIEYGMEPETYLMAAGT